MASKIKSPSAKATKFVAPATALADAMIVAAEEADTTVPELVTNIVSVEPNPITQGVEDMNNTVNPTIENTAAETANDYFADVREKATEVADKGKKLAVDATEYSKANFEAMIEAGKIAAKGAQDMGKTNVEFAKQNFAEMQVAVKEITSVKSPTEFMTLQSEYARKSFDVAIAQASKNTEAMVKLVSDMFQPISNRIAVTTDLFKKAA